MQLEERNLTATWKSNFSKSVNRVASLYMSESMFCLIRHNIHYVTWKCIRWQSHNNVFSPGI